MAAVANFDYLSLLVYGSSNIRSNFFIPVHCHAACSEKHFALTFDDGPHPTVTPQVLALLAQYQAVATFFVIGKHIQGNETILQQIDAAGHSIGNHSYSHAYLIDFKGVRGLKDELEQTAERVFAVIGKSTALFRPPYGVLTPHLAKVIKILDYQVIGWSIRSYDSTGASAKAIAARVQAKLQPGAIILFHDRSDKTLQALKQTLDFAKNNGYKTVSVEQLLKINAYK